MIEFGRRSQSRTAPVNRNRPSQTRVQSEPASTNRIPLDTSPLSSAVLPQDRLEINFTSQPTAMQVAAPPNTASPTVPTQTSTLCPTRPKQELPVTRRRREEHDGIPEHVFRMAAQKEEKEAGFRALGIQTRHLR